MKEIVMVTIQVETNQLDLDTSPKSVAIEVPIAAMTGIGIKDRPYP